METADAHGLIVLQSLASLLTRMMADSAKYAGKDDGFANESEGLVEFSGSGESNKSVSIDSAGAAKTAWRFLGFVDDKGIGEGLGVRAENSFAIAKALLELVGMRNRASLGTIATTSALC